MHAPDHAVAGAISSEIAPAAVQSCFAWQASDCCSNCHGARSATHYIRWQRGWTSRHPVRLRRRNLQHPANAGSTERTAFRDSRQSLDRWLVGPAHVRECLDSNDNVPLDQIAGVAGCIISVLHVRHLVMLVWCNQILHRRHLLVVQHAQHAELTLVAHIVIADADQKSC
jgi:hypothetical protein